jgi:hypothetical protein
MTDAAKPLKSCSPKEWLVLMSLMNWRADSLVVSSSISLDWNYIAVERHSVEPGERPETTTTQFILELAGGETPTFGERVAKRAA